MPRRTIYVPEGEAGDDAIRRIIPQLHAMATSERDGGDDA